MALSDSKFSNAQPQAPVRAQLTRADLQHLRDYTMSFGDNWKPGDKVEYVTPDGVRRQGSLVRKHSHSDWIVDTYQDNRQHVVPTEELQAPEQKVAAVDVQSMLQDEFATWSERAAPVSLGGDDFRISVDYGSLKPVPSNDALSKYVAERYAARILDAEQVGPGRLNIYCTASVDLDDNNYPRPGLDGEEIDGTTVAYVREAHKRIASLNPELELRVGTAVEDAAQSSLSFELRNKSGQRLYITSDNTLTTKLAASSVPAVGILRYDGRRLEGALISSAGDQPLTVCGMRVHADVEPPHSSGTGPQSIHLDAAPMSSSDAIKHLTKEEWEREMERYHGKPQQPQKAKPKRDLKYDPNNMPQPWMEASAESETIAEVGDVVASAAKTAAPAGQISMGDFVSGMLDIIRDNNEARNKFHKELSRYVARKPEALESLPDVMPKVVYAMMQDSSSGLKLKHLWDQYQTKPIMPADGGVLDLPKVKTAQELPPAGQYPKTKSLQPMIEEITGNGTVLRMRMTWDVDDAEGMEPAAVKQALTSAIKMRESHRELGDLGWLSRLRFKVLDVEAGYAEVEAVSKRAKDFPTKVVE